MEIKDIPIEELNPSEYNPRALTEKEYKDLKESLKRFDFVEPIVVNSAENRKNIVIGGHQRLLVAKEMGYKTIPVNYVKITKLEKEQELNLRLNKNLGHFDYDLLANYDEEMLVDVGFSREELDDVFGLNIDEEFDVGKELKKLLEGKERRVSLGDMWQLGGHDLIIGDSTDEKTWSKLFRKERFDFMFTDPPYLGVKQFGRKKFQYLSMITGKVFKNYNWLSIANDFQNPSGANIMIFEKWKNIVLLWQEIEKYWKIRNMIIWYAPNRYQWRVSKKAIQNRYEIALLGDKGKTDLNEIFEEELEDYLRENGQKLLDNYEIILYGGKSNSYWDKRKGTRWAKITDHITSEIATDWGIILGKKPIQILIPYIKILSPRDGIVAEPFCGSGSTIIACEIMKRKCRAIEIEPIYGEVILLRWEKFTGRKAVKINE